MLSPEMRNDVSLIHIKQNFLGKRMENLSLDGRARLKREKLVANLSLQTLISLLLGKLMNWYDTLFEGHLVFYLRQLKLNLN